MKLSLVILLILSCHNLFAQEMDYPELNVTPRASERILLEGKMESEYAWSSLMAIQLSSLTTFIAGAMGGSSLNKDKDNTELIPTFTMATGAIWLGLTSWAATSYRPYRNAYQKLKSLPYKSKREKLTLERLAEEELNELKSLGRRVRWLSVGTNLAASLALLDSVEGETDAAIAANLAVLTAFAPLFFKHRWETVAHEQDKYKKKIFSPVAVLPIFTNPIQADKSVAGISFLYQF